MHLTAIIVGRIFTRVNYDKICLLSQLEAHFPRQEKLERSFKVAARFDDLNDIDLLVHNFERPVKAALQATLATAAAPSWYGVHQVVADIAEAARLDEAHGGSLARTDPVRRRPSPPMLRLEQLGSHEAIEVLVVPDAD